MKRLATRNYCAIALAIVVCWSGCERSDLDQPDRPSQNSQLPQQPASRVHTTIQYDAIPLPEFNPLPPMEEIEPGVERAILRLPVEEGTPGEASTVYVYRPTGETAEQSLPCVFIAAAGATVFSGKALAVEDEPEFIPYVKAGFVVVGYETDGEWIEDNSDAFLRAFLKYNHAFAGLVNARNAIEFALAKIPQVDPNQLFTVGHSSAGRQAVLLAEFDSRIKGCVSFNGVLDVVNEDKEWILEMLPFLPRQARDFLMASSPATHVQRLNCPVFLFHTSDDEIVSVEQSKELSARLEALDKPVKLVIVPGEHYEPMLDQGIPLAVQWLSDLAKE